MTTKRAMQRLKTVWGKAGLDQIPSPDEVLTGTMRTPGPRTKSARTARIDLRVTPDEAQLRTHGGARERVDE